MLYLVASFRNKIANFNKQIRSIGTALRAHGEDPCDLLPQLFAAYADFSSDNGPFTGYIDILENQYNYGTLSLESKYLIDREKVKYNDIKDKLKFKGKSKLEDPILELKAEIEELKAEATVTKTKYVVPGKGSGKSHEITNWIKNPPNN